MAAIPVRWNPPGRPVLQFLRARDYRPLARTFKTQRRRTPSSPGFRLPQAAPLQKPKKDVPAQPSAAPPQQPTNLSIMLAETKKSDNSLLAPIHIPEDPLAILKEGHPSTALLEQSGIVVQRQIEMMNVFLGFEQANRYVIMDPQGNHIGYMAEHDGGIAKTMGRQWFRTHRSFMVHVFGRDGQEVLRFQRPFSWINTRIRVYDPVELASGLSKSASKDLVKNNAVADAVMNQQISSLKLDEMKVIGEAHSEWAPLRRKYNLFLAHELAPAEEIGKEAVPGDLSGRQQSQVKNQDHFAQFAYINEPFLSWDFSLKTADDRLIGSVNRNWGGLGREFFTDTGTYVLRMDAAGLDAESEQRHIVSQTHKGEKAYAQALGGSDKYGMTLDQRAVMLATAVTVDFDYFSRHSHGGGIIPMPFMMGGGTAAEGGAAGGAAGAAGAGAEAGAIGETVGAGAIGTAGRAAGSVGGAGEGAIAGAGTMAGYEAMQRGMGRGADPSSPQSPDQNFPGGGSPGAYNDEEGDVWGSGDSDPWAEGQSGGEGGGGGDGEGGGVISALWEIISGGGD